MTLQEQFKEDIAIFLETADFAEQHTVEGKKIDIVTDDDMLKELKAGVENALSEADLLFYARKSDLPSKRGYGRMLNFDGKDWFVIDWTENFGISAVAIKRNDT